MLLLKSILVWIYRHFATFLIIVAFLVIGKAVLDQYETNASLVKQIAELEETEAVFQKQIDDLTVETITRINGLQNDLKNIAITKLDARIGTIDNRILTLQRGQCGLSQQLRNIKECLISTGKSETEIAILQQERPYIVTLRQNAEKLGRMAKDDTEITEAEKKAADCRKESDRLEIIFLEDQLRWAINTEEQEELKDKHPAKILLPGSGPNKQYRKLQDEEGPLAQVYSQSYLTFQAKRKECHAIKIPIKILEELSKIEPKFVVDLDKIRAPIIGKIEELKHTLSINWLQRLTKAIKAVLPMAVIAIASIIFTPLVIKVFLYFFVAPAASGRKSHALLPESPGTEGIRLDASEVKKQVEIAGAEELLIHPDYVLLAPIGGSKDTKWLLDNRFPLSSIASNMYALTRFRHDSGATYGVAVKNPISQLAVITLPAGSAFVLHPHCLVGIVQRRDHPVAISRHWRLGSLHAWLTLQLRYLVFHGPVNLIVEGCGGVSIGQAGTGVGINQAATIGFGANLPYATTRAEPFFAYLSGTQELFNDSFPSGSGYFIYENTPLFGKKSNVFVGRGLEGITDSVLKLFGV